MFVKIAKLKKLLKEAYKSEGIRMANYKNEALVVKTGRMEIFVYMDYMTKEFHAMLIEIVGEIPASGCAYTYWEHDPKQSAIFDTVYSNLMEQAVSLSQQYEQGKVYLQRNSKVMAIMENVSEPKDKFLLPCSVLEIIDPKGIDEDAGEIEPEAPVSQRDWHMVAWYNHTMAIAFRKRDLLFEGEQAFMRGLMESSVLWNCGTADCLSPGETE